MHEMGLSRRVGNAERRAALNPGALESRATLRGFFDFAPVGNHTRRPGRIAAINLAATRMLQTERAYLIGKPFVFFVARRTERVPRLPPQILVITSK